MNKWVEAAKKGKWFIFDGMDDTAFYAMPHMTVVLAWLILDKKGWGIHEYSSPEGTLYAAAEHDRVSLGRWTEKTGRVPFSDLPEAIVTAFLEEE